MTSWRVVIIKPHSKGEYLLVAMDESSWKILLDSCNDGLHLQFSMMSFRLSGKEYSEKSTTIPKVAREATIVKPTTSQWRLSEISRREAAQKAVVRSKKTDNFISIGFFDVALIGIQLPIIAKDYSRLRSRGSWK